MTICVCIGEGSQLTHLSQQCSLIAICSMTGWDQSIVYTNLNIQVTGVNHVFELFIKGTMSFQSTNIHHYFKYNYISLK